MDSLFFEIGLVIISAAVVGVLGHFLRQPLILAYVAAGILIGPTGFSLVHDLETIHVISSVGIMLMLFLVGLEMNPGRLKDLGLVAFVTGFGQMLFTALIGFGIISLFDFNFNESLYLMVALTLSSTVIAIKLLYDKQDNNALYGQVSISILLFQDIIAIIAFLILTGYSTGDFNWFSFVELFGKGLGLSVLAFLVSKYILVRLFNRIATSHELLILFSLSWAFAVALLSKSVGFSLEIGAFIAGISLASLPYTHEINAKTKVLRDFFITIFFVALGAGLTFASIGPFLIPFIVLSLFVLIGNPIIVMILMGFLGYDKRTSFFTGLTIANISEFSLILITIGQGQGLLNDQIVAMTTLIALLTMTASSYFITYNNQIYSRLKGVLSIFEFRKQSSKLKNFNGGMKNHMILFGAGKMGNEILQQVIGFREDYVVIDHDSSVIRELIERKVPCIFGDVEDEDLLSQIGLPDAEIIISTLPSQADNLFLIQAIEKIPAVDRPIVMVTSDSGREGFELFNRGADYVILRPYLGAEHIHQINRELYQLSEEPINLIKDLASDKKFKSDRDFARILQNLNKLRLKEIKEKMRSKKA